MSQKDKFVGWAAIAVGLGAASTSAWMPTTAASAFATQALGAAAVIYGAWSLTARRHTGGHWGLFAIGLMLTLSPWFGGFIQERAVSFTLSAGIALLLISRAHTPAVADRTAETSPSGGDVWHTGREALTHTSQSSRQDRDLAGYEWRRPPCLGPRHCAARGARVQTEVVNRAPRW